MTGSEIYECLKLLGHTNQPCVTNTDEATAAGIILGDWSGCPYAGAPEMLAACATVFPQVEAAALVEQAKAELARTDTAWGARLAEDALALAGGVPLPEITAQKIAYRAGLRAVIAGNSTDMPELHI